MNTKFNQTTQELQTLTSDLVEFQRRFQQLDIIDLPSIKSFLSEILYMSVANQTAITGWSKHTLRRYKKEFGLTTNNKFVNPHHNPAPCKIPNSLRPITKEEWYNHAWLSKMVAQYPVSEIAKLLGFNNQCALHWHMRKLGVLSKQRKRNATRSQFNNYEWLHQKYIVENKSLNQMAQEAGVFHQTIGRWLIKHGIPVRTVLESRDKLPYWVHRLKHKVLKIPEVTQVRVSRTKITLRWESGLLTSWFIQKPKWYKRKAAVSWNTPNGSVVSLSAEKSQLTKIPKIYSVIHQDMTLPTHLWTANPRAISSMSLIEKEITGLRLANKLIQTNFQDITFNMSELTAELQYIRAYVDYASFYKHKRMHIYTNTTILNCFKTIFHYFRPQEYEPLLKSPRRLLQIARKVIHNSNSSKSTLAFLEQAYNVGAPRVHSPICFKALFQSLEVESVADITPFLGAAALGAASLGIDYYYKPSIAFQAALQRGFGEFIDLSGGEYAEQQVDLVMCCGDMMTTTIDYAMKFKRIDTPLLCFVANQDYNWARASYTPSSIIPVNTKLGSCTALKPDYWFLF